VTPDISAPRRNKGLIGVIQGTDPPNANLGQKGTGGEKKTLIKDSQKRNGEPKDAWGTFGRRNCVFLVVVLKKTGSFLGWGGRGKNLGETRGSERQTRSGGGKYFKLQAPNTEKAGRIEGGGSCFNYWGGADVETGVQKNKGIGD